MNQIVELIETTDVAEVNRLLAQPNYLLYCKAVQEGTVRFYVARTKALSPVSLPLEVELEPRI